MSKFGTFTDYPKESLQSAEAMLLTAWRSLDRYHDDLVLVGGLAVHYLTKHDAAGGTPGAVTMDVDFGISLAASGDQYGTIKSDLAGLDFKSEGNRLVRKFGKLLDASITGVGMPAKPAPVMDLSKIDFAALRSRFKESKHKNTDLEVLKAAIRAELEKLIRLNKTRADFAEKFEELIESYNAGSRNIEELFEELLKLSRNLSEEQQRHVRENMTEEELVIFDILTRPAPELSDAERAEVKKVARELLNRLKSLLVLNWQQKSSARSQLKIAIEDTLDTGLPRAYDKPLYEQKCSALFEHIYESYPERDAGVYAAAG